MSRGEVEVQCLGYFFGCCPTLTRESHHGEHINGTRINQSAVGKRHFCHENVAASDVHHPTGPARPCQHYGETRSPERLIDN